MDADREYQRQLIAAIDAELGALRWSRRHLAQESGIHPQTLDRIFLLRRDMNVQQFDAIARALGVDPEELVHRARGRRVTPSSTSAPSPVQVTDPRLLLSKLLDEPDNDAELLRRLSEAARLPGVNGSASKRLQQEIRNTRRGELRRALEALPPEPRGNAI